LWLKDEWRVDSGRDGVAAYVARRSAAGSGARKSTLKKHQKGQARREADQRRKLDRQHRGPCRLIMQLSIGQCATLACIFEATAPKPGNVHRGADFEDLTYPDLLAAAVAIGPVMEAAASGRVGTIVLEAVRATRAAVGTNANLGTVLLLAPLAAVHRDTPLAEGIGRVLQKLQPADARDVYEAIRIAKPGGIGRVAEADVSDATAAPPSSLLDAMRLAADRDLVARQFVNDFQEVLTDAARALAEGFERGWTAGEAIVHAQLTLMSRFPDSLIARKCGSQVAQQASDRAAAVLAAGQPQAESFWQAAGELDFWLRSDGHRRNPGTTADLIAAGLFVLLREGIMHFPLRWQ
jgi:triphosphoribosyl-dephospho-CoA synthase